MTCIHTLLDYVYFNMDTNTYTGVVFLELKKACDTMDHDILIKKLSKFGVGEYSLKWFVDYLHNH